MATVDNALGLLNLFSLRKPEIGLTEFKQLGGFDKATTHRYLKSLNSVGFLEQNSETKAYRLGPAIVRLAAIREQTFPIAKIAAMHVEQLAKTVGELAHASLFTQEGMSSIHHYDGGLTGTRVGFDPAELLPFHATSSGIAMLAFGPDELLDKLATNTLQKYTSKTDIEIKQLHKRVKMAFNAGYAFMDSTFEADVCSIALPFFSGPNEAAGTIAIAIPKSRINAEVKRLLITNAIHASRTLSAELGCEIPDAINKKWNEIEMEVENS